MVDRKWLENHEKNSKKLMIAEATDLLRRFLITEGYTANYTEEAIQDIKNKLHTMI